MVSFAKNAPSMGMGERLAADKLYRIGCRWSREKPQARKSDKAQSSDCAPVSTIAETSASGEGAWREVPLLVVFALSSPIGTGTRLNSPLEKMWWPSVLPKDPCVGRESLRSPLSYGVSVAWRAAIWKKIGSDSAAWRLALGAWSERC